MSRCVSWVELSCEKEREGGKSWSDVVVVVVVVVVKEEFAWFLLLDWIVARE